jgi:hypothetical protein
LGQLHVVPSPSGPLIRVVHDWNLQVILTHWPKKFWTHHRRDELWYIGNENTPHQQSHRQSCKLTISFLY